MRKSVLCVCVAVLGFGTSVSAAFGDHVGVTRHSLRLADGHADICMANYTQCMNGCDGMSSCEGQCQANYDGCMSQNE